MLRVQLTLVRAPRPSRCRQTVSFGKAGAGHALPQAAFRDEGLLQFANLLVEKVTRYLDQAYYRIRAYGRVVTLQPFPERFVGGTGSSHKLPEPEYSRVGLRPFFQSAQPEEVAIVGKEFLDARPRDVGQLDFRFFGRA